MMNFDLSRLTLVGWFISLVSIVIGIGVGIEFAKYWDSIFPPQPGGNLHDHLRPAAFVGAAGVLAFFLATQVLLNLSGITIMRPKPEGSAEDEIQHKSQASGALYRPVQILIGIILLSLAFVFLLLSMLRDQGSNLAQFAALVAGLLGFACVFTWGRPYTTRVASGLLSLAMIGLAINIVLWNKPEMKAAAFAGFVAFMSGAYAITGYLPEFGRRDNQSELEVKNKQQDGAPEGNVETR